MISMAFLSPMRSDSGSTTIGRFPAMLFSTKRKAPMVAPWTSRGVISATTV